jgi:hypothetical protein
LQHQARGDAKGAEAVQDGLLEADLQRRLGVDVKRVVVAAQPGAGGQGGQGVGGRSGWLSVGVCVPSGAECGRWEEGRAAVAGLVLTLARQQGAGWAAQQQPRGELAGGAGGPCTLR